MLKFHVRKKLRFFTLFLIWQNAVPEYLGNTVPVPQPTPDILLASLQETNKYTINSYIANPPSVNILYS